MQKNMANATTAVDGPALSAGKSKRSSNTCHAGLHVRFASDRRQFLLERIENDCGFDYNVYVLMSRISGNHIRSQIATHVACARHCNNLLQRIAQYQITIGGEREKKRKTAKWHSAELLVRKAQGPEAQIRGSVGDRTQDELDRRNHLRSASHAT